MTGGIELIRYDAIPDTIWSALHAAASDRAHPMRLCTLSTIDEHGLPDARLLVLRGAHRAHAQLWFHTDRRAPKVRQLERHPAVCIITYDPRAGIQLRLRGEATIRTDDEIAGRHWQQTEMAIRFAYGLSSPPGSPIPVRDPRMASRRRQRTHQDLEEGRLNFAVIEITVASIDWLQVSETGDRRAMLTAESNWQVRALSP